MAREKREIWIDNVKVFACVLVAAGHFFQSMVQSEILPDSSVLKWFDQTIYCFHVQLFFICSGYLYQKRKLVDSLDSWRKNVCGKALALGVPYFSFSIITWGMKIIFSGAVNNKEAGLFTVLFTQPISPYWYLYTLFLCFLVTPTLKRKTMTVTGFALALAAKLFVVSGLAARMGVPYVIRNLFSNEVWFMSGMAMGMLPVKRQGEQAWYLPAGLSLTVVFLSIDVFLFQEGNIGRWSEFLLGGIACAGILCLFKGWFQDGVQRPLWGFAAKYTMPVFLMHTIFAAGLRSVLLKMGIIDAAIHIPAGLLVSFEGPVLTMMIMEKMKWPVFLVYPGRKQ